MSSVDRPGGTSGLSVNPFPPGAVARLSAMQGELLTIQTRAVRQTRDFLADYLDRRGSTHELQAAQGNVIAIVGEYGTGKTHLVLEILKRILDLGDPSIHAFYLDAPADTFTSLYRERLIPQLSRRELRDRVVDYMSDVVAEVLANSDLTQGAAKKLRKRSVDPMSVVHNFGLMEAELMQELRTRLKRVTEQSDFAAAFALLLRPEFEAAVWEWVSGSPPDASLRDRGITRVLDRDADVLEAIGVLAFLYGHQAHRFVLVIDEMEKLLSPTAQSSAEASTILAFKKLLEVVHRTRSLIVLSGLPEFLDALPQDAVQRIPVIVRPGALTVDEIESYIREVHRRFADEDKLDPFTRDTISYLAEISGGNARQVLRLCYHLHQRALETGSDVTRAIVREVAREQFEVRVAADVEAEVARVLDVNGWRFQPKWETDGQPRAMADFWIPVGTDGLGCYILVSRSLLTEHDVDAVLARAGALSNNVSPGSEDAAGGILVVNGYVADNLYSTAARGFERMIFYTSRSFEGELRDAVGGVRHRLEARAQGSTIAQVLERLDHLGRQSSRIRADVRELVANSSTAGSALEARVADGIRSVFREIGSSGTAGNPLFPRVTRVFRVAESAVETLWEPYRSLLVASFPPAGPPEVGDRGIDWISDFFVRAPGPAAAANMTTQVYAQFRNSVFALLKETDGRYGRKSLVSIVGARCRAYDQWIESLLSSFGAEMVDYGEMISRRLAVPLLSSHADSKLDSPDASDEFLGTLRDLGRETYYAVEEDLRYQRDGE